MDAGKLLEAELDADGEKKQDYADLGRCIDKLTILDQPESIRPDEDTGDQKADYRNQPQPETDVCYRCTGDDQCYGFGEELRNSSGGQYRFDQHIS